MLVVSCLVFFLKWLKSYKMGHLKTKETGWLFQTVNREQICIHLRAWDNSFVFCFINMLCTLKCELLGLYCCSCFALVSIFGKYYDNDDLQEIYLEGNIMLIELYCAYSGIF